VKVYKELDTDVLLDMLALHNQDYARLMLTGTKEEFELCKNSIACLQEELNKRKSEE